MNWLFHFKRGGSGASKLRQSLAGMAAGEKPADSQSSVSYARGRRYLSLKDDDVAIVFHPENVVEVVLTKAGQGDITDEEKMAMCLALFMKDKAFCDMLLRSFYDACSRGIAADDNDIKREKQP